MVYGNFSGLNYAARRLAAALGALALALFFSPGAMAAEPVMLYQAICRAPEGTIDTFEITGQKINPTSVLMRFVLITPEAPDGVTLARKVVSVPEMDYITFNRNFGIETPTGALYKMLFTTSNLADVYIQKGRQIRHYRACGLTGAPPPEKNRTPEVPPVMEVQDDTAAAKAGGHKGRGHAKAAAEGRAAKAGAAAGGAAAGGKGGAAAAKAEAAPAGKGGAKAAGSAAQKPDANADTNICVSSTIDGRSSTYCTKYKKKKD